MLKPMILAGLGLIGLVAPAAALPLARPEAPAAPLVQVYGGCGAYGHRGPYGGCRAGGQWGGYVGRACPPGWHIGPYGRRCWRNAGYYRPPVFRTYAYGYRRWGWHRRFAWHRGWGWHGGWHRAGWHRWGWRGGWHRRFAWHGGRRWGGFRHAGWHGGFHRGFRGGWHHRR